MTAAVAPTRRPRLRLGVLGFALAIGIALAPALLPWLVEDPDRICVALRDGWALERTRPDMSVLADAPPLDAPLETAAQRAAFQVEAAAFEARPDVRAVYAYLAWSADRGDCVPGAQRRLALSGAGIAAVAIATVPVLRRRR